MTTDVSLQCAQAALGFAALTMGHTATELERIGQLPDEAVWQQATHTISQWLREQYSDELIEQAKATLGDATPDAESESDTDEAAQAAHDAWMSVLSQLLTHCVKADIVEQVRESVTATMTTSWQDAYGNSADVDA